MSTRTPLTSLWGGLLVAALTTSCGAPDPSTTAAGPASVSTASTSPASAASRSGGAGAPGDAAVWIVGPDQRIGDSSSTFTALVSRLGCNSGVTGQVLAPEIRLGEVGVIVTFRVAPPSRGGRCPGNDQVAYEVDLGEPLGHRALIDGQCLPGGEAVGTSFCLPDPARHRP